MPHLITETELNPADLWKLLGYPSPVFNGDNWNGTASDGESLAHAYGYALGIAWIEGRASDENITGLIMEYYHRLCNVLENGGTLFSSIQEFASSINMEVGELLAEAHCYQWVKDIPVQQRLAANPEFLGGFCEGVCEGSF